MKLQRFDQNCGVCTYLAPEYLRGIEVCIVGEPHPALLGCFAPTVVVQAITWSLYYGLLVRQSMFVSPTTALRLGISRLPPQRLIVGYERGGSPRIVKNGRCEIVARLTGRTTAGVMMTLGVDGTAG